MAEPSVVIQYDPDMDWYVIGDVAITSKALAAFMNGTINLADQANPDTLTRGEDDRPA